MSKLFDDLANAPFDDWPDWDEPDPFTEEQRRLAKEAEAACVRSVTTIVTIKRAPKPSGDDRPLFDGLDDKREEGRKT